MLFFYIDIWNDKGLSHAFMYPEMFNFGYSALENYDLKQVIINSFLLSKSIWICQLGEMFSLFLLLYFQTFKFKSTEFFLLPLGKEEFRAGWPLCRNLVRGLSRRILINKINRLFCIIDFAMSYEWYFAYSYFIYFNYKRMGINDIISGPQPDDTMLESNFLP